MNKETLKALKASIRHWEEIVAAKSIDEVKIGPSSCALCGLFNNSLTNSVGRCFGCPVMAVTGGQFCGGSPYEEVEDLFYAQFDTASDALLTAFSEAAKRELEFLKSLLPEDE